MMESLGSVLGDENQQYKHRLPKHPNQQRREMNEPPILSTLGNMVDHHKNSNRLIKHQRKNIRHKQSAHMGLAVDSLSFTFGGMESNADDDDDDDDDDEENLVRRPTMRSKSKVGKQSQIMLGEASKQQQQTDAAASGGGNVDVWAFSSLLTGLSVSETGRYRPTKVSENPTVGKEADKRAMNKRVACDTKKDMNGTANSSREGLSSFLCSIQSDSDDESLQRTTKHRTTTTLTMTKSNSSAGITGRKLVPYPLSEHTNDTRKLGKGEALQKAYATAGRTYHRPHNRNMLPLSRRRLQSYHESDLCMAVSQNVEDDSDASNHQEGNLLSLFQSQLTLSKAPPVVLSEICQQSNHSQFEASQEVSNATTEIRSKRLIFTSPLPKVNRQHKRRDRKKTPQVKSESIAAQNEKQVEDETKHGPAAVNVILENKNVVEYMDENDTASSLSDDSILVEPWEHSSVVAASQVISPLPPTTSPAPPAVIPTKHPQDEICIFGDSILSNDISLIGENIDDTSHLLDCTVPELPLETVENVEHKDPSKDRTVDPIDISIRDVRRSNRARTTTNRFTVVVESNGPPTKPQVTKQRPQPVRSKSFSETIRKGDSGNSVNQICRTKVKSDATERTVSKSSSVIDIERPQRDRKKTDFYHNKISLDETNQSERAVTISHEAKVSLPKLDVNDSHQSVPIARIKKEKRNDGPTLKVLQIRPPKVETVAPAPTIDDDWSTEQLEQLRNAQEDVDPTSTSYWMDVASFVPGKSASECQTKWFSMTKSPAPKTKNNGREIVPYHLQTTNDDDEDDIFQSTPMRGSMFVNANYYQSFHEVTLPKLPTPTLPSMEIDNDEIFVTSLNMLAPTVKPVSKAFLQRMKRNFTKAETNVATTAKLLHKKYAGKNTKGLTEALCDHDVDINIRLSPGGTLQVKSHVDHDDEDDFWDDEYDADEENDDRANYCFR